MKEWGHQELAAGSEWVLGYTCGLVVLKQFFKGHLKSLWCTCHLQEKKKKKKKEHCTYTSLTSLIPIMFNFEKVFQICRMSVLHSVVKQDLLASREGRESRLRGVFCGLAVYASQMGHFTAGCLSNMEASETNLSQRPQWVGGQGYSAI